MNLRTAISLVGTALFGTLAATAAQDEPLIISGSGTTNPSKCFWHIMAKMTEQIKIPTRLTYRAVGSGTGQKEFLGKGIKLPDGTTTDTLEAYNDFGSGDIPISAGDKEAWNDKGIHFAQLPFVLSAVSFFHSIPGVPSGEMGLNMTACLLARVFSADITTWDHEDIKEINPGLNVPKNTPIYVGRRDLGSSSTFSITHYLYAQCPKTDMVPKGWPQEKLGKQIDWPTTTHICDGSGPMTSCIEDNSGAIGYIDAAHGHEAGLNEIRLKNGDGFFLTSAEAAKEGVQAAAEDTSMMPADAFGDFTDVAYYNKRGPKTWPISLVSYVYIRKDLSFIKNPVRRTLLRAFAEALFDDDYIGLCARYGHIPVPSEVRALSMKGIADLSWNATVEQEWTFEKDTEPGLGQGDLVISQKRKSFELYEADRLADDVSPMMEEIQNLKLEMARMKSQRATLLSGAKGLSIGWGLGIMLGTMVLGFY